MGLLVKVQTFLNAVGIDSCQLLTEDVTSRTMDGEIVLHLWTAVRIR